MSSCQSKIDGCLHQKFLGERRRKSKWVFAPKIGQLVENAPNSRRFEPLFTALKLVGTLKCTMHACLSFLTFISYYQNASEEDTTGKQTQHGDLKKRCGVAAQVPCASAAASFLAFAK